MDEYRVAIIKDPNDIEATINRFAAEGMELHTVRPWWSHTDEGQLAGMNWLIVMQPIMMVESESVEPEFPELRQ